MMFPRGVIRVAGGLLNHKADDGASGSAGTASPCPVGGVVVQLRLTPDLACPSFLPDGPRARTHEELPARPALRLAVSKTARPVDRLCPSGGGPLEPQLHR